MSVWVSTEYITNMLMIAYHDIKETAIQMSLHKLYVHSANANSCTQKKWKRMTLISLPNSVQTIMGRILAVQPYTCCEDHILYLTQRVCLFSWLVQQKAVLFPWHQSATHTRPHQARPIDAHQSIAQMSHADRRSGEVTEEWQLCSMICLSRQWVW